MLASHHLHASVIFLSSRLRQRWLEAAEQSVPQPSLRCDVARFMTSSFPRNCTAACGADERIGAFKEHVFRATASQTLQRHMIARLMATLRRVGREEGKR
jgi:hypothetical protein